MARSFDYWILKMQVNKSLNIGWPVSILLTALYAREF
jgi:hypothetical protein